MTALDHGLFYLANYGHAMLLEAGKFCKLALSDGIAAKMLLYAKCEGRKEIKDTTHSSLRASIT